MWQPQIQLAGNPADRDVRNSIKKLEENDIMRYYSTQRPIGPGTYPRQDGTETITTFESRVFCEEIGREAWGFIDYKRPITMKQAEDYELVPSGDGYEV